ncbi:MAG: hypothetical protein ACM35G_11530, partial [Planctomycetaceae bacterium]
MKTTWPRGGLPSVGPLLALLLGGIASAPAREKKIKPSGYTDKGKRGGEPGSNGLTLVPNGRPVLRQHGERRVARRELDGKLTILADRDQGQRLNSPIDAAFKSSDDLCFTEPLYGLLEENDD